VNSDQAKRYLARHGCSFESGKGGHLIVRRGEMKSVLSMHGGKKQIGKGFGTRSSKISG
jgi:mRNA interferase HicA